MENAAHQRMLTTSLSEFLSVIPDRGPKLLACPHCRRESTSGTHNGCHECGKVKHTAGRKNRKKEEE